MLNFIYEKGQGGKKDLNRKFSMTESMADHNFSLMIKAGMLVTRSKGRFILYCVSEVYFHKVSVLFSQWEVEESERMENFRN